jgi:hypothetical protein
LPLTNGPSRAELAARPRWRILDGVGARELLPRVLLVFDGLAVFLVSPTFMIDGLVQADMSSGDPVADWVSRLLK